MRFAYLLPLGACAYYCCILEGLVVLRDHTNYVCGVAATVYRREQGPWRFGRKLDSEDSGERSRRGLLEGTPETHLHVGKARAIHVVTRPGGWPLRGIPCKGLQRGLGEACALLDTLVKIPESLMGVCISLPYSLASAFTLVILLLLR